MATRFSLLLTLVACSGGSTSSLAESDASVDASLSPVDHLPDAALPEPPSDAGTSTDAAATCNGTYDKTCAVASDCLMVAKGCYCGAQPVSGVSKSAQPAAQACETDAGSKCALGCANAPGHVGEDGKNDEGTGKTLEVFCDNGQCRTRLQP